MSYGPPQGQGGDYGPPAGQAGGYGYPPPVVGQPTSQTPQGSTTNGAVGGPNPNVSPGLDLLLGLDGLFVKQNLEMLQIITGWETNNSYDVLTRQGQFLFKALENTDECSRMCGGSRRGFDIEIRDFFGREIIHLSREFICCCCVPQSLQVQSPPGCVLGTVEQQRGCCCNTFDIRDANGNCLVLEGPTSVACTCFGLDVDFMLKANDGQVIGKVAKKWGGFIQEVATNADNFGIAFPQNLDVRMKALLLGATFLIDFMYFEEQKEGMRNHHGGGGFGRGGW